MVHFPAEKRREQRGRTERGACGDLPLSWLECQVRFTSPVGVDCYAGDTGAACGGASTEEGT